MKLYRKFICFLLIICFLFLPSCKKSGDESKIKADVITTKMTIGFYSTQSFNPLLVKSDYNRQCFSLIFDSLYNLNESFEPTANLASDLYIENGGMSATLQLKPGVKFHNGKELNAVDVVKTIEFIFNSEDNYYKYNIRNIASASVINDYTVKIDMSYQTPNIKQQLDFPIVCASDLEKSVFPLNGTGPYKIKKENRGKEIFLMKNTDYHSEFSSTVSDVCVEIIPDKITSRSLSSSGIVDAFFASFNDEGLKTVTKLESTKTDYPTDEYTFIKLNYDNPIMYIKSFRKALSLLVDRKKLESNTFMSHGASTVVPVNPLSWADTSSFVTDKNVDEAKMLISDAGYEDENKDGIAEYIRKDENKEDKTVQSELSDEEKSTALPNKLSFNMLVFASPVKASVFSQLEKDFSDGGIEIIPHYIEDYEEFMKAYIDNDYDMCLVTSNVGYDMDLKPFMTIDGEYGAPVEMGYQSELSKLATTTESDLKIQVYKTLCDKFYDNMPHIPLIYLNNTLITNNKFKAESDVFMDNIYFNILNNKKSKTKEFKE